MRYGYKYDIATDRYWLYDGSAKMDICSRFNGDIKEVVDSLNSLQSDEKRKGKHKTYWHIPYDKSKPNNDFVVLYGYYDDNVIVARTVGERNAKRIAEFLNNQFDNDGGIYQEMKEGKLKQRYSLKRNGEFFALIDNENSKGKFQYDGPIVARIYVEENANKICDLLNAQDIPNLFYLYDFKLKCENQRVKEENEKLKNDNAKQSMIISAIERMLQHTT